jgi:molecular chaperone GrpE
MEIQNEDNSEELSPEELKQKLDECSKLRDEYLAGWKRERADLINYKRDEMTRMNEIVSYSSIDLILKILPVLDNLEMAEKKIPDDMKGNETVKGFLQIKNQLVEALKKQGVEEIDSVNQQFDPNLHEAVGEVETDGESNIVVEELQKGYKFNERVIRASKVKVSK